MLLLPHIEVIEPEFKSLVLVNTHLETLWTGGRWLEGPAWFGGGRYLIFSDIPNDRMMRYDDTDGSVSKFRQPSMNANGNTRDQQGRLISCQHLGRRIADKFEGKKLNSPNDVVVARDGGVWFTDPSYGIDMDYEGQRAPSEIRSNNVYRFDPDSSALEIVATDFVQPNGLAFSPDGTQLYISDTGITHVKNGPQHIRRFDIEGNQLKNDIVFAESTSGLFDGFRVDTAGNVWTSSSEGVHCLNTHGKLIGKIKVPEVVANVCFGGAKNNRLFICGTTSLYATYLNISGSSLL
ncbi:Gluconolactonase [Nymphon striatum]|nr:Gluconolactonase [Nymphon striatum]